MKYRFFFFAWVAVFCVSCVGYKKLRYMANINSDTLSEKALDSSFYYRIRPGDVLFIRVQSSTDSKMELFNQSLSQGQSVTGAGTQMNLLNGHLVDEYGDVELPMVGLIRLSGLTLKEAEQEVKTKVSEYLQFVTITVKLMSFRVSVLGEVVSPGIYSFERVQVSIFDVLSVAGDVTDLAVRKKVRIIRNEKGRNKMYTIDLSSTQLLASEYYYVKPGDVIYVEPLKYKVLKANSTTITLAFSVIALTLSLFAVLSR
jgi:polysaccharide biosynthesis/export protein